MTAHSSFRRLTGARTRDSLSWSVSGRPQALTVYVRFIERGTILTSGACLLHLGASGATTVPRLFLGELSGVYAISHVGDSTVSSSAAAAPVLNDGVELRGILNANGSVQLGQAVNGAAEVVAAASAAQVLPQVWAGTTLQVNGITASEDGFCAFRNIRIVRGIHSLATMRRYAGVS